MTSKEIEQKIAEAFNEHFPGGVTGNLPGYEKAILALIQQARVEELQVLLDNFITVGVIQDSKIVPHEEYVEVNANFLRDRISELKGETK